MSKLATVLIVGAALALGGCSALVGSNGPSGSASQMSDGDVSRASRAYIDAAPADAERQHGWDLRDAHTGY